MLVDISPSLGNIIIDSLERYCDGMPLDNAQSIMEFAETLRRGIAKEIEQEHNSGISCSSGDIKPEAYEPEEVPIKDIEKMMKNGTWKGSLEEEEVKYNIENNYYPEKYSKKLKKLIKYYEYYGKTNKNES